MAADVNFKVAGINNRTQADWDGNSIEFFFQNDPLDLNREEYNDDHNWQFMIALTDPVHWQRHQPSTGVQDVQSFAAANILRKVRPNKDGELVRINFPWALFPKTAAKTGPISAPKDGDLGAMDIVINSANYDVDKSEAGIRAGLGWGGYGANWNNPSVLRPIQFVAKAP